MKLGKLDFLKFLRKTLQQLNDSTKASKWRQSLSEPAFLFTQICIYQCLSQDTGAGCDKLTSLGGRLVDTSIRPLSLQCLHNNGQLLSVTSGQWSYLTLPEYNFGIGGILLQLTAFQIGHRNIADSSLLKLPSLVVRGYEPPSLLSEHSIQ